MRNKTWTYLVALLELGEKAIGSKWVFKLNENPYGSIDKYKLKLV